MTLEKVPPGGRCLVVQVQGSDPVSLRLMEMGLIGGTEIRVVRLAPLGDPMHVTLWGYHLSLRKNEAARVEVEPCQ